MSNLYDWERSEREWSPSQFSLSEYSEAGNDLISNLNIINTVTDNNNDNKKEGNFVNSKAYHKNNKKATKEMDDYYSDYDIEQPRSGISNRPEYLLPILLPTDIDQAKIEATTDPIIITENFQYSRKLVYHNNITLPNSELPADNNNNSNFSTSTTHWGLQFDSNFESGNLLKVEYLQKQYNSNNNNDIKYEEYDLYLQPDPSLNNNNNKCQWFLFRVRNTKVNKNYKFNIVNFSKSSSLFQKGMRPCMLSEKENSMTWKSVENNISYTKSINNNNYSMTFYLTFLHPRDTVYISFAPPYSYTQLQNMIYSLFNNNNCKKYLKVKLLCRSLAGNKCELLTITDNNNNSINNNEIIEDNEDSRPCTAASNNTTNEDEHNINININDDKNNNNNDDNDKESSFLLNFTKKLENDIKYLRSKQTVIITARVHGGETVSSYICEGIIRYLLSNNKTAIQLRKKFVFHIIPMVNPDGVVNGFYRTDLSCRDLNNQWENTSEKLFPTIFYIQQFTNNLKQKNERFLMYTDIHGNSKKKGIFLYGVNFNSNNNNNKSNNIEKVNRKKNARKSTIAILAEENGNDYEDIQSVFLKKLDPRKFLFSLSNKSDMISLRQCSFRQSQKVTGRDFFAKNYKIPLSFSIEASFYCGPNNTIYQDKQFSFSDYVRFGCIFCMTLADYSLNKDLIIPNKPNNDLRRGARKSRIPLRQSISTRQSLIIPNKIEEEETKGSEDSYASKDFKITSMDTYNDDALLSDNKITSNNDTKEFNESIWDSNTMSSDDEEEGSYYDLSKYNFGHYYNLFSDKSELPKDETKFNNNNSDDEEIFLKVEAPKPKSIDTKYNNNEVIVVENCINNNQIIINEGEIGITKSKIQTPDNITPLTEFNNLKDESILSEVEKKYLHEKIQDNCIYILTKFLRYSPLGQYNSNYSKISWALKQEPSVFVIPAWDSNIEKDDNSKEFNNNKNKGIIKVQFSRSPQSNSLLGKSLGMKKGLVSFAVISEEEIQSPETESVKLTRRASQMRKKSFFPTVDMSLKKKIQSMKVQEEDSSPRTNLSSRMTDEIGDVDLFNPSLSDNDGDNPGEIIKSDIIIQEDNKNISDNIPMTMEEMFIKELQQLGLSEEEFLPDLLKKSAELHKKEGRTVPIELQYRLKGEYSKDFPKRKHIHDENISHRLKTKQNSTIQKSLPKKDDKKPEIENYLKEFEESLRLSHLSELDDQNITANHIIKFAKDATKKQKSLQLNKTIQRSCSPNVNKPSVDIIDKNNNFIEGKYETDKLDHSTNKNDNDWQFVKYNCLVPMWPSNGVKSPILSINKIDMINPSEVLENKNKFSSILKDVKKSIASSKDNNDNNNDLLYFNASILENDDLLTRDYSNPSLVSSQYRNILNNNSEEFFFSFTSNDNNDKNINQSPKLPLQRFASPVALVLEVNNITNDIKSSPIRRLIRENNFAYYGDESDKKEVFYSNNNNNTKLSNPKDISHTILNLTFPIDSEKKLNHSVPLQPNSPKPSNTKVNKRQSDKHH